MKLQLSFFLKKPSQVLAMFDMFVEQTNKRNNVPQVQ